MVVRNARRPWVKLLGVAYPLLTALVVVGTANHYLLDVVAGAAIWLASTGITHWLTMIAFVPDYDTRDPD